MRDRIELLIKPASGNCNMRCSYCFYADEQKNRKVYSYGIMEKDVLEVIVQKALSQARKQVTFLFQGGEPTLAGLSFYQKLKELEEKYNVRQIPIIHAIQTNGYLIDEKWAGFFAENGYLVGVSLDGFRELHNRYRKNVKGDTTFEQVFQGISCLKQYQVPFNILTVVTSEIAEHIKAVYGFYRQQELLYQQYIPCIDPLGQLRGKMAYSLSVSQFASFLKTLFDLWYDDLKHQRFIYNRYFENLVGIIKGYQPESCGMLGCCTEQYVIEADGSVYPCDFYVLDEYCIGNLQKDSFSEIDKKRKEVAFIEQSLIQDEACKKCQWGFLCRGGCRRDRERTERGVLGKNYYCEAYQEFFRYAWKRLNSF